MVPPAKRTAGGAMSRKGRGSDAALWGGELSAVECASLAVTHVGLTTSFPQGWQLAANHRQVELPG